MRLQDAIHSALEKERELRYQTAADLEADLKRIRRDLQSGGLTPAAPPRAVSWVALGVLMAGGWSLFGTQRDRSDADDDLPRAVRSARATS